VIRSICQVQKPAPCLTAIAKDLPGNSEGPVWMSFSASK